MKDIKFDKPLVEGVIEKRKSQFTMFVSVEIWQANFSSSANIYKTEKGEAHESITY